MDRSKAPKQDTRSDLKQTTNKNTIWRLKTYHRFLFQPLKELCNSFIKVLGCKLAVADSKGHVEPIFQLCQEPVKGGGRIVEKEYE